MFACLIGGSQIERLAVLQTEGTHYMEKNTALIFDSGRNFTKKKKMCEGQHFGH